MAKYIYANPPYGNGDIDIDLLVDIAELSGSAFDIARERINSVYNHEGDPWWDEEWWEFDAFKLSIDDLLEFANTNEFAFFENGLLCHVELTHMAEIEQDNLAGYLMAEATARFGYSSDAATLDAAARWIAERIGLSQIPYHSGLIILEDGSTLHCSREHGGLFFSLPAPLEPTE